MFPYFGGKTATAKRYPPPEYPIVVEPFAGSAGYSTFHRAALEQVLLFDVDDVVAATWERLLSMSPEEVMEIPLPVKGEYSTDPLYALAVGNTVTIRSFKITERMVIRFEGVRRRLAGLVDECRYFEFTHGPWQAAPDIEATWFIDPPYQPKFSDPRKAGGAYRYGNSGINFEKLGEWCLSRKGQVIVCDEGGADWLPWTEEFVTTDQRNNKRVEVIYHRSSRT